ncbi:MAG: UDP-N-acetylglucosamine 2-epimerase [Bacteroidales bacterium]
MHKIAVCTLSRSEYGLMKHFIRLAAERINTWLILGAGHLAESHGYSAKEVYADLPVPRHKILVADFEPELESATSIAGTVSKGLNAIARILQQHHFDAVVVMGDRYELFSVSLAALFYKIPLVHFSGGEVSEGAIDDSIRHATTKLSHLHLVANRQCAGNVSLMGEEDWRIVITGEPGMDNIHQCDIATDLELETQFGISPKYPVLLVTLHPSTLETGLTVEAQYRPVLKALAKLDRYQVVMTAPGAEEGAMAMIAAYEQFAAMHRHIIWAPHLGSRNYLAVMRLATAVVGNSSSGLVEAPAFGVPTVNIGNRQKNRMCSEAVIHVGYHTDAIIEAIEKASTTEHRALCGQADNPYDPYHDGQNSQRGVEAIIKFLTIKDFQDRITKKFDTQTDPAQWNTLLT